MLRAAGRRVSYTPRRALKLARHGSGEHRRVHLYDPGCGDHRIVQDGSGNVGCIPFKEAAFRSPLNPMPHSPRAKARVELRTPRKTHQRRIVRNAGCDNNGATHELVDSVDHVETRGTVEGSVGCSTTVISTRTSTPSPPHARNRIHAQWYLNWGPTQGRGGGGVVSVRLSLEPRDGKPMPHAVLAKSRRLGREGGLTAAPIISQEHTCQHITVVCGHKRSRPWRAHTTKIRVAWRDPISENRER